MKRILLLLAFAAVLVAGSTGDAHAQKRVYANSYEINDTTRGDTTKYFDLGRFPLGASFTVQMNATKVSGTAAGHGYLQGTSDEEDTHIWFSIAGDSVSFSDADNKHHLNVTNTGYKRYRYVIDPESTDTSAVRVWLTPR